MSTAEWKPIPGHERYEVSDDGRVRRGTKVLTGSADRVGYRKVKIDNTLLLVHRLEAAAFLGPVPPGCEVRHLNDVKDDNRLVNLVYGTRSENMRDRVRNGGDRNRSKTHCPSGHEYDAINTSYYEYGDGRVARRCRQCRRTSNTIRMRAYRAKMKENAAS